MVQVFRGVGFRTGRRPRRGEAPLNGPRCTFSGRVGREPEYTCTQTGAARLRFSVAVDQRPAPAEPRVALPPLWVCVTVWGKQAEMLRDVLTKGMHIRVEGVLRHVSWQPSTGAPRCGLDVLASTVRLLGDVASPASAQPQSAIYDCCGRRWPDSTA